MGADVDQPACRRGCGGRRRRGEFIQQRVEIVERVGCFSRCGRGRGRGGGNLPAARRPSGFKPREKIGIVGRSAATACGLDMIAQAIERE